MKNVKKKKKNHGMKWWH